MINSQLPHNQLLPLSEIKHLDLGELQAKQEELLCSLFHLNGYLDAMHQNEREAYLHLFSICEIRNSFDLEGYPVSIIRLFEAMSSENYLKDIQAERIFKALEHQTKLKQITIENLEPIFMQSSKRKGDFIRERKEVKINSYFTNLTLYTAPNQSSKIQILKTDLNKNLLFPSSQNKLVHCCLLHFQFRALAPYTLMNGHIARYTSSLVLQEYDLLFQTLPISLVILRNKEKYNNLIKETVQTGRYEAWCLFILKCTQEAVEIVLDKIKSLLFLRRKLMDQVSKYTEYNLNADELVPLLMSKPYLKAAHIIQMFDCHRHSAYNYLKHLVKMGILIEKSRGREKLYLHKELVDILSE